MHESPFRRYIALQQAAVKREKAANVPGSDTGGGGLTTLDDGEADDIAAAVLVEGRGLGGSGLGRRSIGHEGNLTGGAGPGRKNAGPGVDHRIADREYEQK